MMRLWQDLTFGVRMLVKSPVFTLTAVVTLGLGIGLNAATFSAIHGLLFRPLPGTEQPEELVQLYRSWPGLEYGSNSVPHFQDLRDRAGDAFESVAAYNFAQVGIAFDGGSERLMGILASANIFELYGVRPAAGRLFDPVTESTGRGAHAVAVLGHGYWHSRFGGDPSVVGRTIEVNGHTFTVIGVAEEGFNGPVGFAAFPLYFPLVMQQQVSPGYDWWETRGSNMLNVVARIRDDRTFEQAQQVVDATIAGLATEYPGSYDEQIGTKMVWQREAGIHPTMSQAQNAMSGVIMAVVGLLLLIACLNVANLFLVRARERRREIGIRLSIGAGRGRIVRQLLTESLLFALVGGAVGIALAQLAIRGMNSIRPPMDGPWQFGIELNGTVLLFTLAITLGTGILFGLAPALQAANPGTVTALKGEGDAPGRGSRLVSALVVGQMALSLTLLVSSGLFLRSLQGAMEVDPGFADPGSLVVASVDPALSGYGPDGSAAFFDRLTEEVRSIPGVRDAGLTDVVPLTLNSQDRGVGIPGYEFAEGELRSLRYARVREGYLEAMGVPLIEGRTLARADDAEGAPVIVVNRRFAERFWPGESALGRIVETAGAEREVVGVVETGKYASLGERPTEFMYLPQRELGGTALTLVVRTDGDPEATLASLRRTVQELDPRLPLYDVRTMRNHMGFTLLPARLAAASLGLFGVLGLVLAAIGIYGVMAYSVAQRRRELGIRVALGADRARVLSHVLGQGMRLTGIGVLLGLAFAAGAGQLVQGMLYGVSGADPVTFVGVPVLLSLVALVAVWLPARRAASVDPMRALKSE